jgi:hypothetical protein
MEKIFAMYPFFFLNPRSYVSGMMVDEDGHMTKLGSFEDL